MPAALEDRLTELEVRLAFVEDTMTTLNSTIARHDRALADMQASMERLRSDLGGVRNALSHGAPDEPPPPHY